MALLTSPGNTYFSDLFSWQLTLIRPSSRGMGTLFSFVPCVIKGGVRPPCGVFRDHHRWPQRLPPREAYEIKGIITLTGPGRGRPRVRRGGLCPRSSRGHRQPGRCGRGGPWAGALAGFRWRAAAWEVNSLVCLDVTSSLLGEGRQGDVCTGAAGHLHEVLTVCLWGCWGEGK